MAKSIFEEIGGTYHEENWYLIPDLTLPTEEEKPIGIGDSGIVLSAGKAACRKRRHNGRTQKRQPNSLGRRNE